MYDTHAPPTTQSDEELFESDQSDVESDVAMDTEEHKPQDYT